MPFRHIGIVGTSEEAVNAFKEMIFEKVKRNRPKISTRIADKAGSSMHEKIQETLHAGAKFVVMPSDEDQALFYRERDRFHGKMPLDIVEMTSKTAFRKCLKRPALLGTSKVINEGFYEEGLWSVGISPITPSENHQAHLDHLIHDKISKGIGLTVHDGLHSIIADLRNRGMDGTVIACPDLLGMEPQLKELGPVVESTRLLIQRTLRYARG